MLKLITLGKQQIKYCSNINMINKKITGGHKNVCNKTGMLVLNIQV